MEQHARVAHFYEYIRKEQFDSKRLVSDTQLGLFDID